MRFFRRRKFENDMDEELRFHIEAYTEDLIRSGLDPSDAERRARIEFGTKEATKDECRGSWGFQFLDGFVPICATPYEVSARIEDLPLSRFLLSPSE